MDDIQEFTNIFALLAVQLRQTDADGALMRGYREGLQDLEPELLKAAAERLGRTAEWFPTTSEWRTAAEAIRRERIETQREHLRKAPRPFCSVCDDTSWEAVDAVEQGRPVRRVKPCRCRAQRRRELLGQVPLPALPPATEPPGPEAFEKGRALVKPVVEGMAERTVLVGRLGFHDERGRAAEADGVDDRPSDEGARRQGRALSMPPKVKPVRKGK
jgi:hypothetical protein